MSSFRWNKKRDKAARMLAEGYILTKVSEECKVSVRSLSRWKLDPDFQSEVSKLTLMVGIALRAERVRIAMRAVRQKVRDEKIQTHEDVLAWLKYVQSETDGIKLDLFSQLTAFTQAASQPVAGSGPAGADAGPDGPQTPTG